MSASAGPTAEDVLRKSLVPVFVLSGAVVVSGFFFPQFVGTAVTGRAWLVVSLLFFGSGLAFVALIPLEDRDARDETDERTAPYLLRIRHGSPRESVRGFLGRQDAAIFGTPVLVFALFFLAWGLSPEGTRRVVSAARTVILTRLDWLFVGAVFLAVLYCLFLLVGPWGGIRLGGPDAEPTYTYPTYFAMFFTAGIAAGIVFWAPSEALLYYRSPPPFVGAAPHSEAAIGGALTYSLFHWGVSAWSAYLVVGLPIAYFTYERGAPLRVSTILTPFVGVDGLDGRWAKLVDVLAVFATIGGVATSVAFVSQQFLAGIDFQWGVTYGTVGPLLFVAGLAAIYSISAGTSVERGIRRIAGINVVLFVLFGLLVFAVGPRSFVVDRGADAVGSYVISFVPMSIHVGGEWVANSTVWNWAWWFSWAPFAGLFLAALSKGRTVRTVVLTGVVATSAATGAWFLLLGGTALSLQHSGAVDVLASIEAHGGSVAVAGFPLLAALPLGQLLMFLFLALIVVFIVSSADTSTLIVSILATAQDEVPTTGAIVFWGVFQGVVAAAVLLVGGGETLQAVAVLTGGPFAVLSLVALVGLTVTFYREEERRPTLFGKVRDTLRDWGVLPPAKMPDIRDDEQK